MDNYKFNATIINKKLFYAGDVVYVLQVKNPNHNSFSGRYTSEWINASVDDVIKYSTIVNDLCTQD